MKGRDIVAECAEIKKGVAVTREWLDAIEARVDRILAGFPAPAEEPQPAEPGPSAFAVEPTDGREGWRPRVQFEGDPVAPSLATLVTPKQLGMMRALAREAGVDYEAECADQLQCRPDELGKRAASAFIDYLKLLQEQGAGFRKVS